MFGKIIVNKKEYQDLQDTIRRKSALEDAWHECYVAASDENTALKTLLSKEEDSQIIKYNGKLYRITSKHHFMNDEGVNELNIEAVYVGEVN